MSNQKLTVSLSPHIYDRSSVRSVMMDVLIALTPALLWSIYVFGIHALRVVFLGVSSCVIFEYLLQRYVLKVNVTVDDGSAAVTGLLLAFNLPSNIPSWMVVLGCFFAIAVAKMTFGGLGNNPFNPALMGRVFLFVSFPVAMTSWPTPFINRWQLVDTITQATPLSIVKESLKNGIPISDLMTKIPSYLDLFLGNRGGCIGEISVLLLIVGGIYLLYRKVIRWHIPVSMIGSIFIFAGILWLINPKAYMTPLFQILTGGVFLGAIYMATDMVTSPMMPWGMIVFGALIGVLTVIIRVFGAYPEGVSFAILIMNAFVPLIDKFTKPKKYGKVKNV
jgi:electron transport complex protein RnfD